MQNCTVVRKVAIYYPIISLVFTTLNPGGLSWFTHPDPFSLKGQCGAGHGTRLVQSPSLNFVATLMTVNNSADVYNVVLWFGISINRVCVGCNWTNYLVCVCTIYVASLLHLQLDSLSLRYILPVSYQLHSMVWHKARKLEEIWWFFFTVRILKHYLVTDLKSTQSDPTSFLYKLEDKKMVGFLSFLHNHSTFCM